MKKEPKSKCFQKTWKTLLLIWFCFIMWWLNIFFVKKAKNLFSAFRTPAVLFVLICLLYIVSGVLLFVGLTTFALVCDCGLGLLMVAMLVWAFIRYSGQYRPVGGAIDQAAGVVLEQVFVLLLIDWFLFRKHICLQIKIKGCEMYA